MNELFKILCDKEYGVHVDSKGYYVVINKFWDTYGLLDLLATIQAAMAQATAINPQSSGVYMSQKQYESMYQALEVKPKKKLGRPKKIRFGLSSTQ